MIYRKVFRCSNTNSIVTQPVNSTRYTQKSINYRKMALCFLQEHNTVSPFADTVQSIIQIQEPRLTPLCRGDDQGYLLVLIDSLLLWVRGSWEGRLM